MGTGKFNAGGNPAMDWHPIQGGVQILLVASCHGNRDKLRPDGPLGSYADFFLFLFYRMSKGDNLQMVSKLTSHGVEKKSFWRRQWVSLHQKIIMG